MVLVWTKDGKISHTQYRPRHYPLSPEWRADQFHTHYKKPTEGSKFFGNICAVLQMGLAGCVAGVKYIQNPAEGYHWAGIMMSGLFARTLGAYSSTYRSLIDSGGRAGQIFRLWGLSLSFAYSVMIIENGIAHVINVTDPVSLAIHAKVWANTLFHNAGRNAWYELPRIREWQRDNTDDVEVKAFGYNTGVHVSRAALERESIYLIPFTLKMAGLTGLGFGLTLNIPGLDMSIPIDSGSILQILSSLS